jgi:hypothetical protein
MKAVMRSSQRNPSPAWIARLMRGVRSSTHLLSGLVARGNAPPALSPDQSVWV